MSSVVLLYFFWEWGGAKILLESVHPPASVTAFLVGKPAPELHVGKSQMWSKQDFHLRSQRGNPVIVHFWATWCAPCVQELPELLNRTRELRKDGFTVIAVAVDDSWAKLETFFARYPALSELREHTLLILDPGGEIAAKFGSSRFPESFLINTQGVIDNKLVGPQPWSAKEIEPYLQRLRQPAEKSK